MSFKDYYYCIDGQTVEGPHSEKEIQELLVSAILKPETLVCPVGEKDWFEISKIQFSSVMPEPKKKEQTDLSPQDGSSLDHHAIAEAGNDKDEENSEEEKGPSKYKLIQSLRKDLDMLWMAQRESIISQVRNFELDAEFETTRKEAKLIKLRVKEVAILYWRKARLFDEWINDLVWNDCDIQRKLRGSGCDAKFGDAIEWLTQAKLVDEAGCYCFKNGKEYLYIGKASVLKDRLSQHRRSVYFEQATHLRIIIPRRKSWISKLERLLLLNYPSARYNDATPTIGNNPADQMIELLDKEMNELLSDG